MAKQKLSGKKGKERQEPVPADAVEATVGRAETGQFPVVGIGASAGGLSAYKKFFSAMPDGSGMAFVLIPHLDPTHDSLMAELLAKQTTMPVSEARNGTLVEPNSVYIIPPNKYLAIGAGVLHLSTPPLARGLQVAIDFFLRSLADDRQEMAIGIILSGTGSHGAIGLQAIKASGGLAMVQDPDTAEYERMPQNAIATGIVDYILPPEQMPDALIKYLRHVHAGGLSKAAAPPETERDQLIRILALLQALTKYDFRSYRKNMLLRRVQRRMGLNQIDSLPDYFELLRENADEAKHLFRDLLIGVTGFFREPEAYQVLEQRVIPQLVERKAFDTPVRIWVPGCATGEEAYSIAMLLTEQFSAVQKPLNVQIFATDIDEDALEFARQGIYPESIAADIPAERLERFFMQSDSRFRVNKQIRESVVFAGQNLIGDAPFSKLDLISCRNLLIYLEPDIQRKVISLFHFALHEDGCLFLGSSETVGRQVDLFETVSKKWRVFRRIGPTRRELVDFPIVASEKPRGLLQPVAEPTARHRVKIADLMHRQLLEDYAPASVLINRNYEILYFHGPTGIFLEPPTGEPTQDLIAMARQGLRTSLRATCHKAMRDKQPVRNARCRVKRNGNWRLVTITVKPLVEPKQAEGLLLVTFVGCDNTPPASGLAVQAEAQPVEESSLVGQLEYELKTTREDLQSTIEEMESSNEELKASNEEVMSMNEELQSANEELETSKEELQSLNEELNTLNSQLQDKVEELDKFSNDMSNLLNSTDIATLFLDTEMRIRQFTPATGRLLGLIATDVGRTITTFATDFTGANLLADARGVLDKLASTEVEVWAETSAERRGASQLPEVTRPDTEALVSSFGLQHSAQESPSRCYLRRVLPYRTAGNRIEGVVVTFVDITQRKMAEADQREIKRMRDMVEHLPAGAIYVENHRLTMNRAAEEITGYQRGELPTLEAWFSSLYGEREPEIRRIYESDRETDFPEPFGPIAITRKDGRERLIEIAAYKFDGHEVWLIHDVTKRQEAEEALRESEERLSLVIRAMHNGIWDCDLVQGAVWVDDTYNQLFGRPPAMSDSWKWWLDHIHPEDRQRVADHIKATVEGDAEFFAAEYRYLRTDGNYADVHDRGCIIRDDQDKAMRLLGSITDITERKMSEQALRESEERMRSVLNTASEAIITIDRHAIIKSVNPATLHMFGYAQNELVGENISILMPPPYRDEHDGYVARYLQTGEARLIGIGREVAGMRKDGSTFPVDLAVSEINHMGLFTGMVRDISDRKELQKQVLDIAEEEDRRIGHELHDGLQQELTGLEMFAATLLQRLDAAERREVKGKKTRLLGEAGFLTLRDAADKLRKGLAAAHAHVQQLSRGILPVQIDAQGLNAALTELASSTGALQEITCHFESREVVEVADNTTATHLYRIAQEAVNNALRHSKGAEIRISLVRQQDQLILEVNDNGVGIDPAISNRFAVPGGTDGIGLRAMQYRAGLIDARLQISPGEEGGTRVRCTIRE
ncbi:MAG: PAS domain S-box protein [Methylococcaceae bacterium]|nr:PAS domain S-box protein [Methylococcaceae bacterium]